MVHMKKNGVLFSVITIILISAIVLFAIAANMTILVGRSPTGMGAVGSKVSFIEDDILYNILPDLLNVSVDVVSRNSTDIRIRFSPAGELSSSISHIQLLDSYETFLITTYASLQHVTLSLDLEPAFAIEPINASMNYSGEELVILNDAALLKAATFIVKSNISLLQSNTTPTSDGGSFPTIRLQVKNSSGTTIYNENPQLDPDSEAKFKLDFGSQQIINLTFGTFDGFPAASLRLQSTNMYSSLEIIELSYTTLSDQVRLTSPSGQNLSISIAGSNLSKNTRIVFFEER